MKPHLTYGLGRWYCYGYNTLGKGYTPLTAWEDWVQWLQFAAEMGLRI